MRHALYARRSRRTGSYRLYKKNLVYAFITFRCNKKEFSVNTKLYIYLFIYIFTVFFSIVKLHETCKCIKHVKNVFNTFSVYFSDIITRRSNFCTWLLSPFWSPLQIDSKISLASGNYFTPFPAVTNELGTLASAEPGKPSVYDTPRCTGT